MDDNWVPLNSLGYSRYEAHSSGLIRNKSNRRILQGHKSKCVELCMRDNNGIKISNIKIDEIMCKIFIGPSPSDDSVIIHLNSDYLDSSALNLCWVKSLMLSTWGVPCTP